MIRSLLQSAGYLLLCPFLAAQQPLATAANSNAALTLPDTPSPNHAPSQASAENWNRIGNLARDEEIRVTGASGRPLRCLFAGATSDEMFCISPFTGRELRFNRAEVETVRFNDERHNRNVLIGTLAVVGFGASFALPRQPGDETPKVITATIFGGVGAFTGLILSPIVHFIPGKLIYRRTR